MEAGSQGESLRQVANRLLVELGDAGAPEPSGVRSAIGEVGVVNRVLDADQEAVVARLREALAGIAATLSSDSEDPSMQAIEIALDGAEFVIRGELAEGNEGRILELLPSFVFLVALAVADRERALSLSGRTAELIEEIEARDRE